MQASPIDQIYADALASADALLQDDSYVAETPHFALAVDDLMLQLKWWKSKLNATTAQQHSTFQSLMSIATALRELSPAQEHKRVALIPRRSCHEDTDNTSRATGEIEAMLWSARNEAIELASVTTSVDSSSQREEDARGNHPSSPPRDNDKAQLTRQEAARHNAYPAEIVPSEAQSGSATRWVRFSPLTASVEVFSLVLEAAEDHIDIPSFIDDSDEHSDRVWLPNHVGGIQLISLGTAISPAQIFYNKHQRTDGTRSESILASFVSKSCDIGRIGLGFAVIGFRQSLFAELRGRPNCIDRLCAALRQRS